MLVELSLGAGQEEACAPVPWGCQLMGDFPGSVFPHSVCWQLGTDGNAGAALGAVNWLSVQRILSVSWLQREIEAKLTLGGIAVFPCILDGDPFIFA